jgi:imidazolonepropionase-like amidohydrolase
VKALAVAFATVLPVLAGPNDSFLLKNATIYPVTHPKIENAQLLVLDGKIAEISPRVTLPKGRNVQIIDGKGLSVYPGMIDSGTQIGLSEVSSVRETVDVSELGQFNPQLRPLIAVNPESDHIPVTRANGITSVLLLPGGTLAGGGPGPPGAAGLIGGQASLIHLNGWTWEEMEIRRAAGMQLRFPAIGTRSVSELDFRERRTTYQDAKRAHDMQLVELKSFFEQARRYREAKNAGASPNADLKLEAMLPLLDRKIPLITVAAREREIQEAAEFADQQKVRLVLAGVRQPGKMLEVLAKKKIPVVLGTPFELPLQEDDPYDETFALAGTLYKAGVKVAFASFGTQFARDLPYEAAQAVAFGLPYEEGLKSITLNPAEIWGVSDILGSVDTGKLADLVVTDGDPLEVRTQVRMVFVKGESVDLETKHTRLYKKYLARP